MNKIKPGCAPGTKHKFHLADKVIQQASCANHLQMGSNSALKKTCPSCHRERLLKKTIFNRYERLVHICKRENIDLQLSVYSYYLLLKPQKCHYCQVHLEVLKNHGRYFLDKLVPTNSYHAANLVACCGLCNATKHWMLTPAEMHFIAALRTGDSGKVKKLLEHEHLFHQYGQSLTLRGVKLTSSDLKKRREDVARWRAVKVF